MQRLYIALKKWQAATIILRLLPFFIPWVLTACISEVSEPTTDVNQQSASPGTVLRSGEFNSSEKCPQGGVLFEFGLDENANGKLDDGEVQQQHEVCNGLNGSDGTNGDDGADGLHALVKIEEELVGGGNCAFGGVRIETGLDDNGDGVLASPGEVDYTQYVCNGADGQDSENAGLNSLIETTQEPEGANCTYGGIRIDSGTDTNGNGVLDGDEKNAPSFVCNTAGVQGNSSLVELTAEPAGPESQCTFGGTRVDSGIDQDGNGSLDPGEINHTSYVCETGACVWTDNGDGTTTVDCPGSVEQVLLNPEALEFTERISCGVSITKPGTTDQLIPMIYSVDKIRNQLRFVTLTILDGQRQNTSSRLLTVTHPDFQDGAINLFFDNLDNPNGGYYRARVRELENEVQFFYIDEDLDDSGYGRGFTAFDTDTASGICNRVTLIE